MFISKYDHCARSQDFRAQSSHVFIPLLSGRRPFAVPAKLLGLVGYLAIMLMCSRSAAAAGIQADVKVSANQNMPSINVNSPVFSTRASDELLLAFISSDAVSQPNTTVKSVSGGALTWKLVVRTNTQGGTSEIWRAFAPAVVKNALVSATLSQSVDSSITVMSYEGVAITGTDGSGAIGAVASGQATRGDPTASLITTQNNSLVVGAGNDFEQATKRTAVAGQSIVYQDLSSSEDTYWVQEMNSTTGLKGTKVTMEDSAPTSDEYNFSICEILPAATTGTAQLTISPSNVGFGSVVDGSSETKSITLSSTGTLPVSISSAAIAGKGYSIVASSWPQTLAPGHTLSLQLAFDPQVAGEVNGQLAVTSNSATNATTDVSLTGTGVVAADPKLSLSGTSLNFGTVTDGSSATKTIVLTSTGTSPVTVSGDSISGTGFTLASGSLPVVLQPAQATTLGVTFSPEATGTEAGSLKILTNSLAAGGALTVPLAGVGGAVSHNVALSWEAPTSTPQPVTGYHVYRATGSAGFTLMNSTSNTETSWVDSAVAGGTTYDYEVKSVDSSGTESTSSNEFSVVVPTN